MVATRSSKKVNAVTLDRDIPVDVDYFAEGAANVVFKIRSRRGILTQADDFGQPDSTTVDGIPRVDSRLKGKLLRLRKDLPFTAPVIESYQHYQEQIEPLFSTENLVEQLICMITPEFVQKCNAEIHNHEAHGLRPEKRKGIYLLESETYAVAITDMTCDDKHASCEFKPKWLVQSPTAPPGSKRCRTCALRAMRCAKESRTPGLSDFCPLLLVEDDQEALASTLDRALGNTIGAPINVFDFIQQLLPYFLKHPILKLLRDLQAKKDPKGVLNADPSNVDFMTAMTLRDCTLFLKIPNRDDSEARIQARLGDLDLKTPNGNKAEYWRQTEQQLIDEGWYTATEHVPPMKTSDPPRCFLSEKEE
ncbi:MAG: hypothetical protein Q9170_004224 [Blastenia crenularia]